MSLYLNYPLDLQSKPVLLSWSNTEIPILAVVTDNKKIKFFQDEGTLLKDSIIQKDKQITALAWHPDNMVMAYGFEDGKLGVWVDSDNYSKDDCLYHESKIVNIKFNNSGNRLVSVDEKNFVAVWFFEGSLTKLCVYSQKFPIENLIFPSFNIKRYNE